MPYSPKCPMKRRDIPQHVLDTQNFDEMKKYLPIEFGYCEGDRCAWWDETFTPEGEQIGCSIRGLTFLPHLLEAMRQSRELIPR